MGQGGFSAAVGRGVDPEGMNRTTHERGQQPPIEAEKHLLRMAQAALQSTAMIASSLGGGSAKTSLTADRTMRCTGSRWSCQLIQINVQRPQR